MTSDVGHRYLEPGDLLVRDGSCGALFTEDDDYLGHALREEFVVFLGRTRILEGLEWEVYVLTPIGIGWMFGTELMTLQRTVIWRDDFALFKSSGRWWD
jgi:hypothetical protein